MSSIPQNTENKNEIFDSATKFLKEFQVGKILFQCNAGKTIVVSQNKVPVSCTKTANYYISSIMMSLCTCL